MRKSSSGVRLLAAAFLSTACAAFAGGALAQDGVVGPSGLTPAEAAALATKALEVPEPPLEEAPPAALGGVDVVTGTPLNEPALAVNPLDPLNVIEAGLFELRVSIDGGLTFSAATPAPVPAGFGQAGDPSVAFDSQGRLFWTYLGSAGANDLDVFISQVNPLTGAVLAGYPVNVTAGAGFPGTSPNNNNDKEWLAADRFIGSPFQDRLQVVWTNFTPGGTQVQATFSTNQGLTWSPALTLSAAGEGFVWPTHNAVAANGDVYVSYHSQPNFSGGAPDGVSGQVFVLRSTDGGVSYPQKNTAFGPGNADITFNVQTAGTARTLPQSASWMQGAAQAWVLPNPLNANEVFVVAGDDPTNTNNGAGFDDTAVFIVRSLNQGVNWSTTPAQIDSGPAQSIQFFPTAAIDDDTGAIAVTWYDSRNGATNAAGNFLLDLFITSSSDGGVTFLPEAQLNDAAFDPDLGAPARFAGPPPTLRIGEYNGVAVDNFLAHAVWTGNTTTGQQILYDNSFRGLGLDHFLLYQLKQHKAKRDDDDEPDLVVFLADQFESGRFRVKEVKRLGTPVDKNVEGINDPATHLVAYEIEQDDVPEHQRRSLRVEDQFGELFLDTIKPDRLLVPSLKSLDAPIPDDALPDPFPIEHFKCYRVELSEHEKLKPIQVLLEDQFEQPKLFDVRKPKRLCNPVSKDDEGIRNEDDHLLCYELRLARGEPRHKRVRGIHINNQFGPLELDTVRERELCVPSVKEVLAPDDDDDDHDDDEDDGR